MDVTLDLIWFVLLLVIFILKNYSTQTEVLRHISIQTIYEEPKPAFFADQMGKKWKGQFLLIKLNFGNGNACFIDQLNESK